MHQAARLGFPVVRGRRAIVQLIVVYIALGHANADIERIVFKFRAKLPNLCNVEFMLRLFTPRRKLMSHLDLLNFEQELGSV